MDEQGPYLVSWLVAGTVVTLLAWLCQYGLWCNYEKK